MWKPQEDFLVVFDDKTGEKRTKPQLDEMVEKMREVAQQYNFDVSSYGGFKSMQKSIATGIIKRFSEKIIEQI